MMKKVLFQMMCLLIGVGGMTQSAMAAGTFSGTVILNGYVNPTSRPACTIDSSLPLTSTGTNKYQTQDLVIGDIDYPSLVASTQLATTMGVTVGNKTSMTTAQVEQKLNTMYSGTKRGWNVSRLTVDCPDNQTLGGITYTVLNVDSYINGVSYLSFDSATIASVKSLLQLQTFVHTPSVGSNNFKWNDYKSFAQESLPPTMKQYVIDNYHVLTKASTTQQPTNGSMSYSATQSYVFTYA